MLSAGELALIRFTPLALTLSCYLFFLPAAFPANAQSILPAADGTNTLVTSDSTRHDIGGGTLSVDGANLFHSFKQFGLSQGEIANFLANPQIRNILGRVVGGQASIIDGTLQVTGGTPNLYLMNPAGIVFGANANLNVPASFTATTANSIGFAQGWFNATGVNHYQDLIGHPSQFAFTAIQPGSIVNAGHLAVNLGEKITLLGSTVVNTGTLTAPGGTLTIAAVPGESLVRISQDGMVLNLELESLSEQALGSISQNPEAKVLEPLSLPQLLTTTQVDHATGAVVDANDRVRLTGSGLAIPTETGTAIVAGTLSTAHPLSHAANFSLAPSPRIGGSINILGQMAGAIAAQIDASGPDGGGTVFIGGDYQGQGSIPNALRTVVSQDSTIRADGLQNGDGGRVIVWADDTTQFWGQISAQGGIQSGNGGFVEVSSKDTLQFQGSVDTSAPVGQIGTLLLDPTDITVVAGPTPNPGAAGDGIWEFTENPGAQTMGADAIATLLNSNSLTLQASNDIDINATINYTGTTDRTLTFQANNSIDLANGVQINSTLAMLDVILNADRDGSGAGAIELNNGSAIHSNGGNIILGGRSITR